MWLLVFEWLMKYVSRVKTLFTISEKCVCKSDKYLCKIQITIISKIIHDLFESDEVNNLFNNGPVVKH